jgi:excisionase family DNA binding protein
MQSLTFDGLPEAIGQLSAKLDHIERLITANATAAQPEPDALLTIGEAAAFLRLSVPTLYGKVHDGTLPHSKRGKRLYFSRAELTEWVKSGRRKTTAELQAEADAHLARTGKKKGGSHV